MDQAKDAEIEGWANEKAENRRPEMTQGDFRTGDLVSHSSARSQTSDGYVMSK
jgi:hypothetical protein